MDLLKYSFGVKNEANKIPETQSLVIKGRTYTTPNLLCYNSDIMAISLYSESLNNLHREEEHRMKMRVLFISSSIGLGHAARDIEIAKELKSRNPELEIFWI